MADDGRSDLALLYRRAGFGAGPDQLNHAVALGYDAAVEELIAGLDGPDPGGDAVPAPQLSTRSPGGRPDPVQLRADVVALQSWWTDRMIATSTPLREKLTLFWHNHFATGVSKVRDAGLMYRQNQLFRTAGGGSFEALVQAVAKDGAMMIWLDISTDKKGHPNENFAREMMELFTLGVGSYSQADVTAGARGFTGWTFSRLTDTYTFRPAQHDYGQKTYLGRTGGWNGDDIVHIAVSQPESARFVAARLWSHFAYPITPADHVVNDLVPAYGRGWSVRSLLRAIFLHPAFRSSTSRGGLVKQPIEYLAGAARALGLKAALVSAAQPKTSESSPSSQSAPAKAAKTSLPVLSRALGQTLFDPPNVGGWGQNDYWLDTATALTRWRAALLLAVQGDVSTVASATPGSRPEAAASLLGVDGWGPTTAAALAKLADRPAEMVALAMVSPEYVLA